MPSDVDVSGGDVVAEGGAVADAEVVVVNDVVDADAAGADAAVGVVSGVEGADDGVVVAVARDVSGGEDGVVVDAVADAVVVSGVDVRVEVVVEVDAVAVSGVGAEVVVVAEVVSVVGQPSVMDVILPRPYPIFRQLPTPTSDSAKLSKFSKSFTLKAEFISIRPTASTPSMTSDTDRRRWFVASCLTYRSKTVSQDSRQGSRTMNP